jgi:hypothetical protein
MFLRGSDRLNRTCVFLGISPKIHEEDVDDLSKGPGG